MMDNTPVKLWHLLTPVQRKSAMMLLGLMLIGMLLETFSVGLVVPALAMMTQSNLAAKYPALVPLLIRLDIPSREQLIIAGMLTLVGVYAVKALFLGFLAWRQASFVSALSVFLSQGLFAGYLRQPYAFHLQRNSAQLILNVIDQVDYTALSIQHALTAITEILVMIGIFVMLLIVEPLGAILVVSTLTLAGWGFNSLVRGHVRQWGEARQHHEGLRIQHLQQGLGGVKDVKLLGRESDFLGQYFLHNAGSARVGTRLSTLLTLPRLWLELLAAIGLAALVVVIIGQGKSLEVLLPTLGLFAAAAFRVMPSVNRMLNVQQHLRYGAPAIDTLYREFRLLEATTIPQCGQPISFKSMLTIDRVSFSYHSTEVQVLRGISFSIPQGASVGFIGRSGAGKSTLVDIILGLLPPVSGTVRVDGVDIQTSLRSWQDQIGYVPQSIYLSDDTLRRNVAFGVPAEQVDETAVRRAIRSAQLEQFVNDLPQGLDTLVGERGIRLSGGQRQRIGIARALYHDPKVLVLDEATSSLDTATESGVMDAVRSLQGEKTLIIVSHRLSTVAHCSRLFRIERGTIVDERETNEVLRVDKGIAV